MSQEDECPIQRAIVANAEVASGGGGDTSIDRDNSASPEADEFDRSDNLPCESNDAECDRTADEALPLLTRPRSATASSVMAKRRRLSVSDELTASCSSNGSSFQNQSFVGSSSFSQRLYSSKCDDKPLDTEMIAREVRVLLRQRCMRQTDLAPYVGCRPGSVAGVIAKAGLPWSALNDFNRSVFTAMAKWIDDARNNQLPGAVGIAVVNASSSITASPVPSCSSTVGPSSIAVVRSNSVTTTNNGDPPRSAQPSQLSSPVAPPSLPPANISQPWAVAKCSINTGYLLFLENMHVAVPGRGTLFAGANLSIASGKRYGVVGPSECGTSTLLKFIAAKDDLNIPPELEIIGCDQSKLNADETADHSDTERTIDYVLQLENRWSKLKAEEAVLEPIVKKGDNREAFARLRQIYEQLCYFGSGAAEAKARQLLTGLGFSLESQNGSVKDLSLRSRKVAALARALFSEPALLLIDRPTNYLDVDSVIWLETYLKNWPTSLLIVTQDRCFMDAVCSAIIYVHSQKLFYYQGNYSRFKQQISQK